MAWKAVRDAERSAIATDQPLNEGKSIKNYSPAIETTTVTYKALAVDGLNVAYREAGRAGSPKLVLLHGFPSSSHQYRNLIPTLADRFHVIAPDYPGFGGSDAPEPAKFSYTFDSWPKSSSTSSSRRASTASVSTRRITEGQLAFES